MSQLSNQTTGNGSAGGQQGLGLTQKDGARGLGQRKPAGLEGFPGGDQDTAQPGPAGTCRVTSDPDQLSQPSWLQGPNMPCTQPEDTEGAGGYVSCNLHPHKGSLWEQLR